MARMQSGRWRNFALIITGATLAAMTAWAAGTFSNSRPYDQPIQHVSAAPSGPYHIQGAQILDSAGRPYLLRGTELIPFDPLTAEYDNRAGMEFGGHSGTTLSALRLRFNLNSVRLPVTIEDAGDPKFFERLSQVVRRANDIELLVVLAARSESESWDLEGAAAFWTQCAEYFRESPGVFFEVSPAPVAAEQAAAHSSNGWREWRTNAGRLVAAIRSAGAQQPVIVNGWHDAAMFAGMEDSHLLDDPNVIYQAWPRYVWTQSDADRDRQFGFLAGRVPVMAAGWDLELENAEACAALPDDPAEVTKLVEGNFDYFDKQRISWTVSKFAPGKLVHDFSVHHATWMDYGWTCGKVDPDTAGRLGRLVQARMRSTDEQGLFVVAGSGGMVIGRGAFAIAYGAIMANRDSGAGGPDAPEKLGGVAISVTDARGVTRPAQMLWASAGWGQANFVVPGDSAAGPAMMTMTRDDGSRASTPITVAETAPSFFTGHSCRGAALGEAVQTFADGREVRAGLSSCDGADCRTDPVPLSSDATTHVRIVTSGIRHARRPEDIELTIGGELVPVVSFSVDRGSEPGRDFLVAEIPERLRGLGETDMVCRIGGMTSNVVRIPDRLVIRGLLLAAVVLGLAAAGCTSSGAGEYAWELPNGFPPPAVPADNPMSAAKVELGRHLFYDTRLSANRTQSCASCHRQELAFTDGRARALGSTGELHPRGSMSLVNVAYNATFTWANPGLRSLEDQVLIPLFGEEPVELGMAGKEAGLLARLKGSSLYREQFAAAFPQQPEPVTAGNLAKALASFVRSIISARSPYDRYYRGGEPDAVTPAAIRGEAFFHTDQAAGCFRCHAGPNFSDASMPQGGGSVESAFHNTGLYNLAGKFSYPGENLGLYTHTGDLADAGRFRTPSLRNIALTAPYMHDGSAATLEDVLDHYGEGGRTIPSGPLAGRGQENPRLDALMHPVGMTKRNRADLLAFLHSLTDGELLRDKRFANPWEGQVP